MIKEFDYFGLPINLEYAEEGTAYKTAGGGVLSILIRIFMIAYTIILLNRLVNYGHDLHTSIETIIDDSSTEPGSLEDTKTNFYLVVASTEAKIEPFKEIQKYIRFVAYSQKRVSDGINQPVLTHSFLKLRECRESDFDQT